MMKRYNLFFATVLLLTFFAALPVWASGEATAITNGGNRLVEKQGTDGGWGWPLNSTPPTPNNTVGPIAMGLAQAYKSSGSVSQLAALQKAGSKLLAKTNNFSPSDGYLAVQLDKIFGGVKYTDHVLAYYYGPLANGTYMKCSNTACSSLVGPYSTTTYAALIRTQRTSGGQPNLAAWDLGVGLVAAASAGADAAPWISELKTAVNNLAYTNADYYWEPIGLAGALYGFAFVNENYTPTAGDYAGASGLSGLAAALAGYQISGGGFSWDAQDLAPGNEDVQLTAYAILALNEVSRTVYGSAIQGASNYLVADQLPTGGWDIYEENNELTGEAIWAISVAADLGQQGAVGPQGPQGPQGEPGTNGTNGIDGINGATGSQGPVGPQGPIGLTGLQGPAGTSSWTDGAGIVSTLQNVGVGQASAGDKLDIYSENDGLNPGISVHRYINSAVAPSFRGFKARGTGASSPEAVQAGDIAFSILGFGYETTTPSFKEIGGQRIVVESISGSTIASYLRFDTTNTSGSRREVMRITGSGNMGIGTSAPTQKVEVNGGVRLNTVTVKPACDAGARGTFWFEQGASDDSIFVCTKVSGSLVWKKVALQ